MAPPPPRAAPPPPHAAPPPPPGEVSSTSGDGGGEGEGAAAARAAAKAAGMFCEYMGHDVSNMRGFDSYRLLTLFLASLMTRISSAMIEGAHTSEGAATLARTVPFWGRFCSPREPSSGAVLRVPTAECHKHCAVPPSPTGCLVLWLGCPNATILALARWNAEIVTALCGALFGTLVSCPA